MAYAEGPMGVENEQEGRVVVCTARNCRWNEAARCVAEDGIMVSFHQDHADCNTYTHNTHIPGEAPEAAEF